MRPWQCGRPAREFAARGAVAALLLCSCLLAAADAGERANAGPGAGGAAGSAAEVDRVRRELAGTYRRVVDAYIATQPEGRTRAQVTLIVGGLYETGRLGDPDPVLAEQYYRKAAETGLTEAKTALANLYHNGAESATGRVARDPARARELYAEAAAGGSVPAMLALGIIYADGMDVDPDPKKALEYLVEAGKRADPAALDRLEPIMRKAREWEEARPGRKGKANFPTTREELIVPALVQEFIDNTFDLDRFASHTFVEISVRIKKAMEE